MNWGVGMTPKKPRYWDSWKGKVLRAIAIKGAKTWQDVRETSGLTPPVFNRVLAELLNPGVLEKRESGGKTEYSIVSPELGRSYRSYAESAGDIGPTGDTTDSEILRQEHVKWINGWIESNKMGISTQKQHFFLRGPYLSEFTRKIIEQAKRKVEVVNPFVERGGLGLALRDSAKSGKTVLLITRDSPDSARREFHLTLRNNGAEVLYNGYDSEGVHTKITVVDDVVAVVSSLNFIKSAEAAASWETGVVTFDADVVSSIVDSIRELCDEDETTPMD